MPSIVGSVNIVSMDHSAIVNLGDCVILSPKSTSKSFAGSGSFNTADSMKIVNNSNVTKTNDSNE
ncbi:spore germination protein [Aneurinibacillus tyrosinisolvens]|uniref:spore germination protein n=1 Tax=Aneurinibacillus tyrosinisolvens TaxID=1443435 RepID=UPI00063F7655|nr:spore germination protein [Aneurinibacillus tyrosinisolvens]